MTENEERNCKNCKYFDVDPMAEPCWKCLTLYENTGWEEKEGVNESKERASYLVRELLQA